MNISNSITSLLFWICVKLIQVCTGVTKKEPISFLERRYTRRYVPIFLSFFSVLAIFQIFIFLFSPIFRLSHHDTRSRPAKSVSEINFSQLYPQIIVLKTSKTTTLSSHEYISCLLWFFRSEDGLSGLLLDGRWLTTLRRCWPFKSCKETHENEGLLSYIIISSILSWRWRWRWRWFSSSEIANDDDGGGDVDVTTETVIIIITGKQKSEMSTQSWYDNEPRRRRYGRSQNLHRQRGMILQARKR